MKTILIISIYAVIFSSYFNRVSAQLPIEMQNLLGRISPNQRGMVIDEYKKLILNGNSDSNRFTQSGNLVQSGENLSRQVLNEGVLNDIKEEDAKNDEDTIILIQKLESILIEDLESISESLTRAKEDLNFEEYKKLEIKLNYQKFDINNLIDEIRKFKIDHLKKEIEELKSSPEDELKPFGYEIFNNAQINYFLNDNTPIPADYMIGTGDTLEINLYGLRNDKYTLSIGRNGLIQFPEVGPLNVFENGTDFKSLKNLIKEKIRSKLGSGVEVSVSMGAIRNIKVFLTGEFIKPGVLFLPATSTLTEALFRSGGIGEYGSLRNITLSRENRDDVSFDFYSMLLNGVNPAGKPLLNNDIIFIPTLKKRVTLDGEVIRPAIYEINENSSLKDIITLSGGFRQNAFPGLIEISRISDDGKTHIFNLDFKKDQSFSLNNGDYIKVMKASSIKPKVVELNEWAERPGVYEWRKGLFISDLFNDKNSLAKGTDLNYALIKRTNVSGKVNVLSFSPNKIFAGDKNADVELFAEDKIIVLPKDSSQDRKRTIRPLISDLQYQSVPGIGSYLVQIEGMVHFPSEYPLTDQMTVSSLISAGGGMLDSAYTMSAEIARVEYDQNKSSSEAYVNHITLPSLLGIEARNFRLKPNDVLTIKTIPSWIKENKIDILGEVKFPGSYLIKKEETLFDVIIRAGGLTSSAFPSGTVFTRRNLIEREEKQKEKLISQLQTDIASASLSGTSSASEAKNVGEALIEKLKSTESTGRLVIDLESQLSDECQQRVVMRDGDSLYIPTAPHEISVLGEVQFPTSHLFDEKLSINEYILKSGGYTRNADEKRIFVIKTNGSVFVRGGSGWFSGNSTDLIKPGDVIVVPINLEKGKWIESLTSSSQVIYQLAITAAAVNSF